MSTMPFVCRCVAQRGRVVMEGRQDDFTVKPTNFFAVVLVVSLKQMHRYWLRNGSCPKCDNQAVVAPGLVCVFIIEAHAISRRDIHS